MRKDKKGLGLKDLSVLVNSTEPIEKEIVQERSEERSEERSVQVKNDQEVWIASWDTNGRSETVLIGGKEHKRVFYKKGIQKGVVKNKFGRWKVFTSASFSYNYPEGKQFSGILKFFFNEAEAVDFLDSLPNESDVLITYYASSSSRDWNDYSVQTSRDCDGMWGK